MSRAFNRMSEQIEDHDRVRDEFVSNASHELKTPLSAMKVLSESILYENDPDPGVMREFFLDVNSEVDRLTDVYKRQIWRGAFMKKRKSLFILCCAAIAILSGVLIIVFNNEKKLDEYTYAAGGASRTLPLPSGSVYQDIGGMNMLTFKVKMHKEEVQAFYDD